MPAALVCAVCLGAPTMSAAQSAECVEAYDTLTKIREQLYAGGQTKPGLAALHHKVRSRTADCSDLTELWQMRARLAEMLGDATDVATVKARGSAYYRAEPIVARTAFNAAAPIGKRWALIAGTGTFAHKDELRVTDLEYAETDISLVHTMLSQRLGFSNVETLAGSKFTLDNWRSAIARLRENVSENDLVMIYLVSHGKPTKEDSNNTSFILTHASRGGDAAAVYTTSLQVIDLVQELSRELRAQRVVIILDACFSGDAISGQRDYAGHPAPNLLEAFTRGSGRAVIAAARANQRSWELPARKQGAFAYCLDKVTSPTATLGETFSALRACVASEVTALGTGNAQEPEIFASEGTRGLVLGAAP